MNARRAGLGWLAILTLVVGCAHQASPPLRVCFESNNAPFSSSSDSHPGIDYEIASLVADTLARPLAAYWYVASNDEDLPMPLQASMLLSERRCELVAGYPLVSDGLGDPSVPELDRSEPDGSKIPLQLGALLASDPYLSLPLTLVSSARTTPISRLDHAVELGLVVEQGSLASAIATAHGAPERRRAPIRRLPFEGDAIFDSLEAGAADVALVELHRFEIYRARVPTSHLQSTNYRHPLAVNTGFVGIDPTLLAKVSGVLKRLVETTHISDVVVARGLSYSPPVRPAILPPLTPRLLMRHPPETRWP